MAPDSERCRPISILIAVAVRLYRDGLAGALSGHKDLRITGTAATSVDAHAAVRVLQPDVVVVDVSLDDALGLMRALRAERPQCHILAFAVQEDISTILEYAQAGADGFVTANGSMVELIEAIERTAAGELLCSPRMAAELLRRATGHLKHQAERDVARVFTIREQQVFSLLKQGRSNKEIAVTLHIAEATVKNHVHHILEKLQVSTRSEVAAAQLNRSI